MCIRDRARAIHVDLLDASVTSDMFAYFYVSHGIACPLIIKYGLLSPEIDVYKRQV